MPTWLRTAVSFPAAGWRTWRGRVGSSRVGQAIRRVGHHVGPAVGRVGLVAQLVDVLLTAATGAPQQLRQLGERLLVARFPWRFLIDGSVSNVVTLR